MEQHGETRLIARLNETAQDERDADLVVSTAHKAKGREWDTVELADDFLPSRKTGDHGHDGDDDDRDGAEAPLDPAEVRLFYVALTRARTAVQAAPALLSRFGVDAGPRYRNPSGPRTATKVAPRPTLTEAKRPPVARAPAPEPPRRPKRPSSEAAGDGLARWWWLLPITLAVGYLLG